MSSPLVSVIIPTYNRPTFLKEAIDSVVGQTYVPIEILVIDDGSNINYAEEICNHYKNCTYLYKKNGGLSSARNFGIKKSNGAYIAFLDDDDFWRKDKIEKQVAILETHKEVDLVHSSAMVVTELGESTGNIIGASKTKVSKRSGNVFWNALGVWVVKSPTPLLRRTVFTKDLLFDETIKVGEDIDFYQRLFYRHQIYYIDEPLAFYREFDNPVRLSKQREKYIGIEKKMIANFREMGVHSPIILHKIKIRLAKQAVRNWNSVYPNDLIKINYLTLFLNPSKYIWEISDFYANRSKPRKQ
ncbi:glycosyltransferase family 2 protein [Jejudonia soesokkakensis]|uniref:Glycosyltransferase family 2 protein n=1 Tax=Jejudonia soesokkakensis TaxID=1323432 RepID=A0ABW2MTM3_9FLAO